MSSFSIFETFFFLILAITFFLIVLLVYHFKQRVTDMEQKSDKLFTIVQSLANELSVVKSEFLRPNMSNVFSSTMTPYPIMENTIDIDNEFLRSGGVLHSEDVEFDDEISDDEISDDDDDISCDTICDDNESDETDKITIPPMGVVKVVNIQSDLVDDEESEEVSENTIQSSEMYRKMSVPDLRKLVITRGLNTNPSKIKKGELIELLTQE
jgi:hypothetical protein